MRKLCDKILVIDLESTCWPGDPPDGQVSEIIEIGLCVLDVATLRREENLSIIVRPQLSTVSDFCTALTTLTQAEVDDGIPLTEACRVLRDRYRSQQRVWASYGEYDRWQFEICCSRLGLESPFGSRHVNVKSLFALARALPREIALDGAMKCMGWPLEGTHHRGGDDAWNIGRILGYILQSARKGP